MPERSPTTSPDWTDSIRVNAKGCRWTQVWPASVSLPQSRPLEFDASVSEDVPISTLTPPPTDTGSSQSNSLRSADIQHFCCSRHTTISSDVFQPSITTPTTSLTFPASSLSPQTVTSSVPSLMTVEDQFSPYIAARLPAPGRPVDGEVLVIFRGYMPGIYRSRQEFREAIGVSPYAFWDSFNSYMGGRDAWVDALQKGHIVAF